MTVPPAVAGLLSGRPDPGRDEQAFPFITVDEHGFPHCALLSRSELDVAPSQTAVLAAIGSTRTRANLARSRQAALIAVSGSAAHYIKLRLVRSLEDEGFLGCALEVAEHKEDSLGIPLSPIGFTTTEEIARMERWDATARLLARLAEG